jgi:hypothetical protein
MREESRREWKLSRCFYNQWKLLMIMIRRYKFFLSSPFFRTRALFSLILFSHSILLNRYIYIYIPYIDIYTYIRCNVIILYFTLSKERFVTYKIFGALPEKNHNKDNFDSHTNLKQYGHSRVQ